jgi:carotenoid cleavage dioxygenase-like enzyme
MPYPNLLTATRKPLDIFLEVKEGAIPNDLSGFVFINSGAGTVNSEGLPYSEKLPDGSQNPEYGSPVINGDGYMFRFDLTQEGKIHLRTEILKTPCYYADLATSPVGNPKDNRFWDIGFKNFGLARISSQLGTRNQLNTAITPFRLPNDAQMRMLATFDAGRPFEFDPQKLELITPIGRNKFWESGMPPFMKQPLAMVLTTAHPVFDPQTKEVFTVNFTKTTAALMEATTIFDFLPEELERLEKVIENKIDEWEKEEFGEKIAREIEHFFDELQKDIEKSFIGKFWNWLKKLYWNTIGKRFSHTNDVYLIRWQGETDPKRWKIVDENGDGIEIQHNMHQIGFTKDYILLADTNFKFSFDIMINNPFPQNPKIDAFIRKLISGVMNDYSTLYIVKRSDLTPQKRVVKAQKTTLPVETVHFSANYENPNGIITVHTAHNCSACPAEWLRPYDVLKISKQPVDTQRLGLIAVGEMDIGKIGKCVINANTGTLLEDQTKFLYLTGQTPDSQAHTWAVGLYTYKDMLSPDVNVGEIKHIFWQSYGLSQQMLTKFIYNLYKNPKRNRVFSAEEILEFTKKEAPFILECVDTDTMNVSDYFLFPKDYFMWSLQFVPRKNRNTAVAEQKDGYIFCTVITHTQNDNGQNEYTKEYNSEIWIFDANNLAQGAVCKLQHESLTFAFTIHSVWVKEAATVSKPTYILATKPDYDYMIRRMKPKMQSQTQTIFNEFVYPHFDKS